MLSKFIQLFKECVFPVFCAECGGEEEWWCADCLRRVDLSGVFCCPVCGRDTARGEPCPSCAPVSWLDGAAALLPYVDNSPQAELIQRFKYGLAADIQRIWETLWRKSGWFMAGHDWPPGATVIPIPLHKRRERERGYNQAAKIAEALIAVWGLAREGRLDIGHLIRVRATAQQVGLSRVERQKNVRAAFAWTARQSRVPAEVILVDDVFTTGATMQECAKVLKAHGAKKVLGLTLARG